MTTRDRFVTAVTPSSSAMLSTKTAQSCSSLYPEPLSTWLSTWSSTSST
jgi:hypothetical protein